MSLLFYLLVFVVCFIWGYFITRKAWVSDLRISLLNKRYDLYLKLPTETQMIFRYFYVWDYEKFPKI